MFSYSEMQHPVQDKGHSWVKTVALLAGHPASRGNTTVSLLSQGSSLPPLVDTERTPESYLLNQTRKTLGKQQTEPEELLL